MNLLLFEKLSSSYRLAPNDPRLAPVLRLNGDRISLGVVNGPRGVGVVKRLPDGGLEIVDTQWENGPVAPPPKVDLVVGLPRPAEARRILFQAASMGVRSLTFVELERTPPGYRESRSLKSSPVARILREGLEQGFHTALPDVRFAKGLGTVLEDSSLGSPVVLDPYLGQTLLGEGDGDISSAVMIVLGSERGFSPDEQEEIRLTKVRCCHLGPSILRTDTAVVAALALIHRHLGISSSARRSVMGPLMG